ncbi:MAG: hypothetical protein LBF54_01900 [Holosporaceae bacterium]|jgi:hypothetical protein|nr:hypothetical protein [Holosporaceae bacterium]
MNFRDIIKSVIGACCAAAVMCASGVLGMEVVSNIVASGKMDSHESAGRCFVFAYSTLNTRDTLSRAEIDIVLGQLGFCSKLVNENRLEESLTCFHGPVTLLFSKHNKMLFQLMLERPLNELSRENLVSVFGVLPDIMIKPFVYYQDMELLGKAKCVAELSQIDMTLVVHKHEGFFKEFCDFLLQYSVLMETEKNDPF